MTEEKETPEEQIKTETSEEDKAAKVAEKELVLSQMRNEVSTDVFGNDFDELEEAQQGIVNKLVSKMKKPRKSKSKKDKEPKRTAGRMIAPTLRVVDEDNILRAIYTLESMNDGKHYKGGWGEVSEVPKSTKTSKPVFVELIAGLQSIVTERQIADDTIEVVPEVVPEA